MKSSKRVMVAAFCDLPAASALMAQYNVPATLSKRGFYFNTGDATKVLDAHPESELPDAVVTGGMHLVRMALTAAADQVEVAFGKTQAQGGFHADLDAAALRKAFAADDFEVLAIHNLQALGPRFIACSVISPWPIVKALLAEGVAVGAIMQGLIDRGQDQSAAPEDVDLLVTKLTATDLPAFHRVLAATHTEPSALARHALEKLSKR